MKLMSLYPIFRYDRRRYRRYRLYICLVKWRDNDKLYKLLLRHQSKLCMGIIKGHSSKFAFDPLFLEQRHVSKQNTIETAAQST